MSITTYQPGAQRIVYSYTPTMADVSNTVSETTVLTATVAQAVDDGDKITLTYLFKVKNDGASRNVSFDIAFGGVESDLITTWSAGSSAQEGMRSLQIDLVRNGSDMSVGVVHGYESTDTAVLVTIQGVVLAAPTFTVGQTLDLKVTLSAASATFYLTEEGGFVEHWKAP